MLDVDSALAPNATLVHGMDYIGGAFRGFDDFPGGKKNVCQAVHVEWGDVDAAFAAAAHVVEGEFYFPMIYAYAMEPYVAIADYDARGQLTVYSSAQHPFMVRHDLAEVFDLPLNSVRVIVPFVGGGYGSKSYTKIEPLTAACSWKVGAPGEAATERGRGFSYHALRRRARAHSHGGGCRWQTGGQAGD